MTTAYSDEIRAAAIAAVAAGASIASVARQHGVSRRAVQIWRDQAHLAPSVSQQNQVQLGELIADYLRTGLAALASEARLFGDPDWLKGQSASDLAILHGVLADKLVRILAGVEAAAEGLDLDAPDH